MNSLYVPNFLSSLSLIFQQGINTFLLSFLLTSGPLDQIKNFIELDPETQAQIISDYHNAGIALMVSAFGESDAPTTNGADPIATANSMAAFVIQYGLDGIDVDYEDFDAINAKDGSAENWLISFTNQLRSQLPQGRESLLCFPMTAPYMVK